MSLPAVDPASQVSDPGGWDGWMKRGGWLSGLLTLEPFCTFLIVIQVTI